MTKHLTSVNLDSFLKNAIGFENLFSHALPRLEHINSNNYPPYNIIAVDDDHFRLEVALAGFAKDDIEVTVEDGYLTVQSHKVEETDEEQENYIYKGISSRSFMRSFKLGEHVEVTNASMDNGILVVEVERIVPEALKPKQIEVK